MQISVLTSSNPVVWRVKGDRCWHFIASSYSRLVNLKLLNELTPNHNLHWRSFLAICHWFLTGVMTHQKNRMPKSCPVTTAWVHATSVYTCTGCLVIRLCDTEIKHKSAVKTCYSKNTNCVCGRPRFPHSLVFFFLDTPGSRIQTCFSGMAEWERGTQVSAVFFISHTSFAPLSERCFY